MFKKEGNIAYVTYDYYHNKIIDIKNNPTSAEIMSWHNTVKLNYSEEDVFIIPVVNVCFEQTDDSNQIKKIVRNICNGLLTNILDTYLNNRLNEEKGDINDEE